MDSLIFLSLFVNKFLSFFQFIFVNQTKPTRHSLLLLLLGIVMTSSLSVRKCYMRIISRISGKSLNSFYNLLTNGKIDLNVWSAQLIRLSLRCIPAEYEDAPILLAVDDTLVEKEGSHFAHRERLFDHSGYRDKKNDKENSQERKGHLCALRHVQAQAHSRSAPSLEARAMPVSMTPLLRALPRQMPENG